MEINEEMQKEILESKNKHMLGDQVVDVKKVTPYEYKLIMGVVQQLPGILYTSFTEFFLNEDKQSVFITLMSAGDIAMDEIIEVTSLLTKLDKDYIEKQTGLDELVHYLFKLSKRNSLDTVIKNMVSPLLNKIKETQVEA